MKALKFYAGFILFFAIIFNCSCKKEEVLAFALTGDLQLQYKKGFPQFNAVTRLTVDIQKDGTVTFTGGGDSDDFDAEEIYYEDGGPVTKIRMAGTLTFFDAAGEIMVDDTAEYVLVRVHSLIDGQMTVWGWGGDDIGWLQVLDIPYTYEDDFSDGTLQFNIQNASSPYGEEISKTLPDIEGTFTYGYKMTLIVIPN